MAYSDPYEEWKAQGRPGGSFEAWMAQQGGQAAPQVSGGSVAPPAPTPAAGQSFADMIRAASTGQSEDFGRFSNEQILAWQSAYDPAASAAAGRPQFRSEGGGGALVDKPTECPPGTTLHGSTCVEYGNLPAWAQSPDMFGQNPLQNVMASIQGTPGAVKAPWTPVDPASSAGGIYGGYTGGQGAIPGKGGVEATTPNPAGPYGGYAGGQNIPTPQLPTGPVQSSLTSLIAPLQSGFKAPTQFQGGLTNMMAQRTKPNQRWFA